MKIKVNSQVWKKAITQALNLVGKNSGNPNESCVGIHVVPCINGDYVELRVVEAGVHMTKITVPNCEVSSGSNTIYVQYSSLDKLNKNLDTGSLEIIFEHNKIIYSLDNLGAISEPIFHNQDPFKGMLLEEEEYTLIEDKDILLKIFQSKIKPIVDYKEEGLSKKSRVGVSLNKENSYIFGQVSLSGYISYKFKCNTITDFGINGDLLKKVSFIFDKAKGEEENTITIEKSNKHLKLSSINGASVITLDTINKAVVNQLLSLSNKEVECSTLIKIDEFAKVIKWQSYNKENGDNISIFSKDNELLIQGNKADKPSTLEYGELEEFTKITIPTDSLITVSGAFSKEDTIVNLKKVDSSVGDHTLKVALFSVEGEDINTTIYLYEQPTR